jgi:amino acid permease
MDIIILIATTIGAGIFSLPYIFYNAGWLINLIYFLFLGFFLVFIHYLYSLTLLKTQGRGGLLELIKENLNLKLYPFAFILIILGLILTLLIYLILGGKFLNIIFPSLNFNLTVLIFWLISSVSLIFGKFFNRFETLGAFFIIFIILFVFFSNGNLNNLNIPAINLNQVFLPFGPLLFALAGWTAIFPMLKQNNFQKIHFKKFILGTAIIIVLYLLFILGIINASPIITEDALSGLNWPYFKLVILALLGLFAIWTSYLPIGLEIKNSLSLFFSSLTNNIIIIFSPIILFYFGLQSFLKTINLAGGVFLALQYLFILILENKVLNLNLINKLFIKILKIIFLLACFYEIYFYFAK